MVSPLIVELERRSNPNGSVHVWVSVDGRQRVWVAIPASLVGMPGEAEAIRETAVAMVARYPRPT